MVEPTNITFQIKTAMKIAMRARDKDRLATIRLIQAEIQRIEVDERTELGDSRVISVLGKMVKQRRASAQQYRDASRPELSAREEAEIMVIQEFLPSPLSSDQIDALINEALANVEISGMAAMGAVMNKLKPRLEGRADLGEVSKKVRLRLSS